MNKIEYLKKEMVGESFSDLVELDNFAERLLTSTSSLFDYDLEDNSYAYYSKITNTEIVVEWNDNLVITNIYEI